MLTLFSISSFIMLFVYKMPKIMLYVHWMAWFQSCLLFCIQHCLYFRLLHLNIQRKNLSNPIQYTIFPKYSSFFVSRVSTIYNDFMHLYVCKQISHLCCYIRWNAVSSQYKIRKIIFFQFCLHILRMFHWSCLWICMEDKVFDGWTSNELF